MIESLADCKVVVRYADKSCMLSEGISWLKIDLRNCDRPVVDPVSYYVRFQDGWAPKEAIVETGLSEMPLQWTESSERHLRTQTTLRYVSTRLRQVNLVNAEVIPQDSTSSQQATLAKDKETSDTTSMTEKPEQDKCPPQPPQNGMTQLDPQQRKSFSIL